MPPTTRKRGAPSSEAPEATPAPATKRRRASQASSTKSRTDTPARPRNVRATVIDDDDDDDDLFGEKSGPAAAPEDDDIIDLATSDGIPAAAARPPKEDRRVKIGAFQCAICMDDCTDLTVTHCGHLFCAECLHSALHIEATRNKCPICRTKIDNKDRNAYSTKTKGFWPLELKLMTAADLKGKGKQR
ncbi:E3 ubiquitin-protein ligase like [Verticillium longisporum]|nr:E3 ubiquitin-protein ligase like [Verticillium longisporum]